MSTTENFTPRASTTENVGSPRTSSTGIGRGAVPTQHHPQERNSTLQSGHTDDSTRAEVGHDEHSEYPEQKHAGKTGYGPNFKLGPTMGDKMDGAKEILKGKVKRNPELVQHGRDEISGKLQQRERELDMHEDPFKHGNDGAGSEVQKEAATADITGSA
ncbi:hypothetical protein CYLTODRAFT_424407 [Cylindrobasidium torrendii FP15055 ss-10]|uniref:Uncharacterized protein n=1 Tax=Cylindrobasidium torrendii FP15055 ss-10 TaxID=1314674 RepID=A0A0D7B761_9AGAR|nr:hypothetical protein CYLTODRAFT_424407 [Cylindrobasidium torrendii FP15055 ss-10]